MEPVVQPHELAAEHFPKYGKVYTLGDPRVRELLSGPVCVQEKVDGSQFRFGMLDGRLATGSHRVDFGELRPPDNMFAKAVAYIKAVQDKLRPGWLYFGEYLARPRHNTIAYSRVPTNGIMLFDAYNAETGAWMVPAEVSSEALRLGIDGPCILDLYNDPPPTREQLVALLQHTSYLGGSIIEGLVIKNYGLRSMDPYHGHCPMMAKYVRESFKEENTENWRQQRDIGSQMVARYKTIARWEKALLHLREEGKLEHSMRDVPALLEEIWRDIEEEAKPAILEMLWEHFKHEIRRGVTAGAPEWLKERLFGQQFAEHDGDGGGAWCDQP